jgi:hypothetical protein
LSMCDRKDSLHSSDSQNLRNDWLVERTRLQTELLERNADGYSQYRNFIPFNPCSSKAYIVRWLEKDYLGFRQRVDIAKDDYH